jgi:hypothetical protein
LPWVHSTRLAIGELLDYLRFAPPATRPAILLPARPSDDLVDLITSHGIVLIYEEAAGTAYPQVLPKRLGLAVTLSGRRPHNNPLTLALRRN